MLVVRQAGAAVTVDVNGVAGTHDWSADTIRATPNHRHGIAFVRDEGACADSAILPSVGIVPDEEGAQCTKHEHGRTNVSRALLLKNGASYRNAWGLLLKDADVA